MKQVLIALALVLTLSATTINARPLHRHHPQTTAVVTAPDSASKGVDAYSDTASVDNNDAALDNEDSDATTNYNPADYDNPFSYWNNTIGWGFGGTMLATVTIILVFLFLLAPFIILALVIRYLIKRHNDKVKLAEKAMETGRPVPESLMSADKQSDEYMWKRGVRHIAVGLGLMIMFWFWGATPLAGIGALVACAGAGQVFIARSSESRSRRQQQHDDFGTRQQQENFGTRQQDYRQPDGAGQPHPQNEDHSQTEPPQQSQTEAPQQPPTDRWTDVNTDNKQ